MSSSAWTLCVLGLLGDESNSSFVALSWDNSDGLYKSALLLITKAPLCAGSKAYLLVDKTGVLCSKLVEFHQN